MYRINGKIEGIAPLLFNRFTEEAKDDLDKGKTGGKFTPEQRREEAMNKVYKNGRGLYLPAWTLKKCLLRGCQLGGYKEGKMGLAQFLEATVFFDGDLLFGLDTPDFLHEVMGKIPPRTGAAAIIRRPALNPGWTIPFTLVVADDKRDSDRIKEVMQTAGLLAGLGSWRPEYGRFVVREWEKEV